MTRAQNLVLVIAVTALVLASAGVTGARLWGLGPWSSVAAAGGAGDVLDAAAAGDGGIHGAEQDGTDGQSLGAGGGGAAQDAAPGGSGPDGGAASATVVVHVAGAVARPGVYPLAAGARVVDAVAAAGGATKAAALDAVNLAAILVDAQQVYIPSKAEVTAYRSGGSRPRAGGGGEPSQGGFNPGAGGAGGAAGIVGVKVDINLADRAALDALPGIGPATADRIIAYRRANGPFAAIEDLKKVPGIGDHKFEAIRDLITVR